MATLLGALSYQIRADTKGFQKDLGLTRKELNATRKIMRETKEPAERLKEAQEQLGQLHRRGALTAEEYTRALRQVREEYVAAIRPARELEDATDGMDRRMFSVGQSIQTAHAAVELFKTGISAAASAVTAYKETLSGFANDIKFVEDAGLGLEAAGTTTVLAKRLGLDSESVQDAFKEFKIRLSEAAALGSGPAAEIFDELGLNVKEFNAKPVTEALTEISKLTSMLPAGDQLRISDELMGDAGQQLVRIYQDTGKAIQDARADAEEFNLIPTDFGAQGIKDAAKALQDSELAIQGLTLTLIQELAPAVKELGPLIADAAKEFTEFARSDEFKQLVQDLVELIREAKPLMRGTAAVAREVAKDGPGGFASRFTGGGFLAGIKGEGISESLGLGRGVDQGAFIGQFLASDKEEQKRHTGSLEQIAKNTSVSARNSKPVTVKRVDSIP